MAAVPLGVYWRRNRATHVIGEVATDMGVAVATGALIALAVLFAAEDLETAREIRDIRRDNLRFVREVAVQSTPARKPFRFFDLEGQVVAGFDLSDSDLTSANLRGADLSGSDLKRSYMHRVDAERATFTAADFREAALTEANLAFARLSGANLRGANLTGASLRGVDFADVCWDRATKWPKGSEPKSAPNCGLWDFILTGE